MAKVHIAFGKLSLKGIEYWFKIDQIIGFTFSYSIIFFLCHKYIHVVLTRGAKMTKKNQQME